MNMKFYNNIRFLLYCLIILINNASLSLLSLSKYPDYVINNIVISSFRLAQITSAVSIFFAALVIIKLIKCRFNFTRFEKHVYRIFIVLNLLIGFLGTGIDNWAHIGGLIGGVLTSIAVGVKYKSSNFEKVNGFIVIGIFIAFLAYMIWI